MGYKREFGKRIIINLKSNPDNSVRLKKITAFLGDSSPRQSENGVKISVVNVFGI